jgi:hypothetical protein
VPGNSGSQVSYSDGVMQLAKETEARVLKTATQYARFKRYSDIVTLNTTMIYTPVLSKGGRGERSPADAF